MRITARQLRQIIREELLREGENPGSAFDAAVDKGNTVRQAQNEQLITKELTETLEWFQNEIFPMLDGTVPWKPVVTKQVYAVSFWENSNPPGGIMPDLENFATSRFYEAYIRAGERITSPSQKVSVYFGTIPKPLDLPLKSVYTMLEKNVIDRGLRVPMQSFPD